MPGKCAKAEPTKPWRLLPCPRPLRTPQGKLGGGHDPPIPLRAPSPPHPAPLSLHPPVPVSPSPSRLPLEVPGVLALHGGGGEAGAGRGPSAVLLPG